MDFPLTYSICITIVLALLLLFYAVRGYKNGFLLELVMFASIFISAIISYILSVVISQSGFTFSTNIDVGEVHINNALNQRAGQLVIFLVFFVLISLAFYLLRVLSKKFNNIVIVGTINRLLGSVLGFAKGCIYVMLVVVVLASPLISNGHEVIKKAQLQPVKELMQEHVPVIKDVLDAFDTLDTI